MTPSFTRLTESSNLVPSALLLALFALLPMVGELTTWAKNAANHREWALDSSYHAVQPLVELNKGDGVYWWNENCLLWSHQR